jgi:hypothetical protein
MSNGQIMLAYTIKAGININEPPIVYVGQGSGQQSFGPSPVDNSYWWYFLSNANPQKMLCGLTVPGTSNTTVPPGVDAYMTNPAVLFGIVTQSLSSFYLPQGALYDYLVTYGAGDALQMLEQANATLACGYIGQVSYVLAGQGGPRGGPFVPPSYEDSSLFHSSILQVSLASLPSGQPPYSIIDTYTF